MNKDVWIMWTGGWDSTFRLVELSFKEVNVFPVYVLDTNRKSKDIEMLRMEQILDMLRNKPLTRANIHDVKIIELESIAKDDEISQAYRHIQEKTHLGTQHEWLAWLGKTMPGIELGTEAGNPETSHIIDAIQSFGKLIVEDNIGRLDPQQSTKEGMLVLGWFTYPLITRTEQDMLQLIKQWGYEDVMKNIWFCHTPIKGKPCGMCHPCDVKMESDMCFLLPKKAQLRYKVHRFCSAKFGQIGKRASTKILRRI